MTLKSLSAGYLIGKWSLTSFRLESCSMRWNWGESATDRIEYDSEGKMKVDIKAEKSNLPYFSKLIFNNVLVYGGSYKIQNNLVVHRLDYC
jgi:hypothetical protein